MARILIPTALRQFTEQQDAVEVNGATRISPSWTSASCSTSRMTRASPSATPGEPTMPGTVSVIPSDTRSHSCTRSVVMPNSMIVTGSVTAFGAKPRAGGGVQRRSPW